MFKWRLQSLYPLSFVLSVGSARALTYEEFKNEVSQRDPVTKALKLQSEAATLKARKADEPTAVRVFSGWNFMDDTRPTSSPAFQGNRTTNMTFGLGLRQQTSYGAAWSISQNLSRTKIYGVSTALLPQNVYYDFYPKAEVSVPLWRNFWGGETSAMVQVLERLNEIQNISAKVDAKKKEVEIETTFYKYGIQKFLVELNEKNLDRTQRLFRWIEDRRRKNLTDESDAQQVRAILALRELELDRAQRSLQVAFSEFNLLRNQDPEIRGALPEVSWKSLEPTELQALSREKRSSYVELLKAKDQQMKMAQATAERAAANPQLDLTGGVVFMGRDDSTSQAIDHLKDEKKNMWNVGLTFQMPIDFTLQRDLGRAARLEQEAASARLKNYQLDQNLSWTQYKEELLKCSQSVKLLGQMEEAQRKRFLAEDSKYKKGRSTLFVVLSSEQDFINAQSQRLANELQCRIVKAQNVLFSNEGMGL